VATATPHRVVVADDSAFMRRVLTDALSGEDTEIVGVAADGDEALAICERERPDVLSLDLAMPGRDGIGVLRALRARRLDVPVVVVSAFSPSHGVRAVDALAEGAFELVAKPAGSNGLDAFVQELGSKVRAAAETRLRLHAPVGRERPARTGAPALIDRPRPPAPRRRSRTATASRVVLIACSTGGPRALAQLLPGLGGTLGRGTLIVQHMPTGFTASLAARLDRGSALQVTEAADGDTIAPGRALLAPGGSHLRVGDGGTLRLSDDPAIGGLRPRADLTITDAVRVWGEQLLLVVLTGMGRDGLEGARAVRHAGGRVLVEAESSCVVYGMPRAIVDADLADEELDLHSLTGAIRAEAGQ
jgi:two-component system chemotaxis response regulator CheB